MIGAGDLKRGITVELDGTLYQVLEYQHIKVGRGGANVRLRLRDIQGGHTIERTFSASEKFQRARLESRGCQFLYREGNIFHFMDKETYDQIAVNSEVVGGATSYLLENGDCDVLLHQDRPVSVEVPVAVVLTVTQTEPGFKGDTATGGSKPAVTETGLQVQVPLFVNEGDRIKVDTRTGEYLERAG